MEKILLDTDLGTDIDDALCLSYLLKNPQCQLMGITTVSGEADKRAMLCSVIANHLNRNVPIYVGASRPLLGENHQPTAQQARQIGQWPYQEKFPSCHGVNFLKQVIEENPGEITLLAIGPLTNLGLLFSMYPHIPGLLKRLVLMCGRFYQKGTPEWNAFCDPYAAAIVYSAPDIKEFYSIGLDVTTQVVLQKEIAQKQFASTHALRPVKDFVKVWFDMADSVTFHDPLAAAVLFQNNLCSYEQGNVEIELMDAENLGKTIFTPAKNGRHLVAKTVDSTLFFQHYFAVLNT